MDGLPVVDVEGCLDVDLESSALTNTLPIQRLDLEVGADAACRRRMCAPASWGWNGSSSYTRAPDDGRRERYHCTAPAFGFEADLVYDETRLVLDYPGIAVRML